MKTNLLLPAMACFLLFACENKTKTADSEATVQDTSATVTDTIPETHRDTIAVKDTAVDSRNTSKNSGEGTYTVDAANSAIYWEGKKPGRDHTGIVKLSDGKVTVSNGQVTGGQFTIDFRTIENLDMKQSGDMKGYKKLTNHLKSEDFFGVDKYPTGSFVITKVTPKNAGKSNTEVTGNLTVKGKTNPVSFPAQINITGDQLTADAGFQLDRRKYDIRYGSKTFFPDKAVDDIIEDNIGITLKLAAKK
jgi:polyisoprenoid-binding protein YceI